jgi:hypothetical protein
MAGDEFTVGVNSFSATVLRIFCFFTYAFAFMAKSKLKQRINSKNSTELTPS